MKTQWLSFSFLAILVDTKAGASENTNSYHLPNPLYCVLQPFNSWRWSLSCTAACVGMCTRPERGSRWCCLRVVTPSAGVVWRSWRRTPTRWGPISRAPTAGWATRALPCVPSRPCSRSSTSRRTTRILWWVLIQWTFLQRVLTWKKNHYTSWPGWLTDGRVLSLLAS